MDVKSCLPGMVRLKRSNVCQPPCCEYPGTIPDKGYKVVKHYMACTKHKRAWYDTLATYLSCNGFKEGKIDQNIIANQETKGTYLACSNICDDIIFGSTKKSYVMIQLHRWKSASTPTDLEKPLVQDGDGLLMFDEQLYRSNIGSLIYLKGKPSLGLWYSKDSPLELVAYTDSDYAGATQDRKSTTGGCQFLGNRLISWQCKKQTVVATSTTEAEYVAAASCCGQKSISHSSNNFGELLKLLLNPIGEVTITAIIDGQSKTITEASLRRHLKLEDHDGITSIPNSEIFEQLVIMEYHVPSPNESPLHVVHSHGSDEGSLKLNELTNLVTKLSERIGVLEDDLKKTKQTYSSAFTKLILRIKKLESKVKTGKARKRARVVLSEDEEDDSSKQGRIDEDPNTYFAQDDEVVHDQDTAEEGQLEDSTAGITVSTAPINISTARETHSTAGRVVYGRRSKEARKDKGKAIMTEPEPEKKSKKLLEQERLGLEEAIRLQEKIDEEERAQVARDEEIARQLLALE
ncbi:hypothetical protein Tco_0799679 [Tanacetum coccineum]|uniref:Uncharacterized protein n=1 Tax=Tanacetum coccineum TaxID=301880 RepID=A0ABQ4ZTA8_9ASTR